MLSAFEIYDGYMQHIENLSYLIGGGHFTRLVTYLDEYMVWFIVPAVLLILVSFRISFVLRELSRYLSINFSKKTTGHGSARWVTIRELNKLKMLKTKEMLGKGVVLGTIKFMGKTYFVVNKAIHTFLMAPTRSGKGIGSVITTILTYLGSLIIHDPKGNCIV